MRRWLSVMAGVTAAVLAPARLARAQAGGAPPEPSALLGGPSTCPQPDVVWRQIATLVPRDRLAERLRLLPGPRPPVQLFDLGASFRVVVGDRIRDYRDDARDCAARAQFAAVFIGLAVSADDFALARLPTPAAPPPVALPPAPAPMLWRWARLGVGATAELGLAAHDTTTAPGVALRLALGRRWGAAAGFGARLPLDISIGGVRVRQSRLTGDVDLRVATERGARLRPYVEAGATVEAISERALDLAAGKQETAFAAGARAAGGVELLTATRVVWFAALEAQWVAAPPSIFALPAGDLGATPVFWLGLTAGLALGLR